MITARCALLVTLFILSTGRWGLAQPPGVQPFGNGVTINIPGSPPFTLQVFGEDVMMNVPGQPPSVLRSTDTGGVVRLAGRPISVQRAGTTLIISAPGAPPITCTVSAGRLDCR